MTLDDMRAEFKKKTAEWLRTERAKYGLDQSEVAARIGVSASAISGWEAGRQGMSAVSYLLLKQFFLEKRRVAKDAA